MAKTLQDTSVNITRIGLDLDSLPEDIKQGYYTYALNLVNNGENVLSLTNENKFTLADKITFDGFTIIGSAYIKDSDILFVAVDNVTFRTKFIVYDIKKKEKKKEIEISEPYYDKSETVAVVIATKLGNYYAYIGGQGRRILKIDVYNSPVSLSVDEATLEKEFIFPQFELSIESGGQLKAGSYSIAVRYMDSDENYTNWILTSNTVNIFSLDKNSNIYSFYGDEVGKVTDKSINIKFTRLDSRYSYYQLGIITAESGVNAPDTIYITEKIPIHQNIYIITSTDKYVKGDIAEVMFNKVSVEGVKAIEIYSDRLVAGNIKYKKTDDKSFQLLASKIKSEVILKPSSDPRDGVYISGGFMPGEVYAFGIVYVFKDGSVSQVYHIPSPVNEGGFKPYYITQQYEDWYGQDYNGNNLVGTNVRLHQFPFRDEAALFQGIGTYRINVEDRKERTKEPSHITNGKIKIDGVWLDATGSNMSYFGEGTEYFVFVSLSYEPYTESDTPELMSYRLHYTDGSYEDIETVPFRFYVDIISSSISVSVLGIKLSNIQLPDDAIGYFIVYDKKQDFNRRIIDNGYANLMNYDSDKKLIYYSYLDNTYGKQTHSKALAFHSPVYNYRKLQREPTKIRVVARVESMRNISNENIQENVLDGTSSNGLFFGLIKDDNDGMDYNISAVFNHSPEFIGIGREYDIEDVLYLRQTEKVERDSYTVMNMTIDDQVNVLFLASDFTETSTSDSNKGNLYYISLINDNIGYTNLDQIIYIPLGYFEGNSCEITMSDVYISYWSLSGSVYNGVYSPKNRKIWETASNVIGHILLMQVSAAAAAASIVSGNAAPAYGFIMNALKNVIGLAVEQYNLIYQLIDNDSDYRELSYHGAITYPSFNDDTIRFSAETFIMLPIDSIYNNQLRLKLEEGGNYFTGSSINDYISYIKTKHLFHDYGRDTENRTLSLRFVPVPEVYVYNESYLRVNDYKEFLPFNGNNITEFPNRIIWSAVGSKESKQDGYSMFLPLDYKDIDDSITALKSYNGQLLVWTKDKLYRFPRPYQEKLTDEMQLYVGTGSFLSVGPVETVDDDIQSYGTVYPNTIIKFKGFLAYVNSQGYPILLNGNKIKNLGSENVSKWLSRNSKIRFKDVFYQKYGYKYPINNPYHDYGVGYILAYDDKRKRLLFTLRDFDLSDDWTYDEQDQVIVASEKIDTGFTLSFSLLTNSWISFHDYIPNIFIWNYNVFCFIVNGSLYFLDESLYNNNFIIELLSRRKPYVSKVWEDIRMNIDVYNSSGNILYNTFFDYITFYTFSQVSIRYPVVIKQQDSLYLYNTIANSGQLKIENIEGSWRLNNMRNYKNNDLPIVTESNIRYRVKEINYGDSSKNWTDVTPIRDKYIFIRLEREQDTDTDTRFVINTFVSQYTTSIN